MKRLQAKMRTPIFVIRTVSEEARLSKTYPIDRIVEQNKGEQSKQQQPTTISN